MLLCAVVVLYRMTTGYEEGIQMVGATMRGPTIVAADGVGCAICAVCAAMGRR